MISFKEIYTTNIKRIDEKNLTFQKVQAMYNYPIEIIEVGKLKCEEHDEIIETFDNYEFYENNKLKSFYVREKKHYTLIDCVICYESVRRNIQCVQCSASWCVSCHAKITLCPQCRILK